MQYKKIFLKKLWHLTKFNRVKKNNNKELLNELKLSFKFNQNKHKRL